MVYDYKNKFLPLTEFHCLKKLFESMTIVEIPFKTVLQEPTLKLGCVPHHKLKYTFS